MSLSLVAYGDSDSDSDDSSVHAHQPETEKDVRTLLSVLPPARTAQGVKGRVRIGLPKIEKGNDSDDSDDEIPVVKRRKQGGGGGGLASLLPSPKGDSNPFAGAKKPPTTRNMVPYTLSKRYQDSRANKTKKKSSKLVSKKDNSDSDSDGEPVSFFSHLDTSSVSDTSVTTSSVTTSSVTTSSVPTSSNTSTGSSQFNSSAELQESNFGLVSHSEPPHSQITSAPLAPKPFSVNAPPSYSDVPSYPDGVYQTNGEPSVSLPTTIDQQLAENSDWFPSQYDCHESAGETSGGVHHGPMPGAGPGLSISDEAFRRLAGGKKRRNRTENLNDVIDINEDEVKDGIKSYQKYHSEEAVNKLYKVDPSKVAEPTGDQKRKHQLSWLAYQAKTNELQLLNQWSQSAATKRQTQMKYGF